MLQQLGECLTCRERLMGADGRSRASFLVTWEEGGGGNASKPLLMKTSACWHSHLSHRRGSRQNWHYGVNKLLRQRRIVRHSTCQWGEQRHLCLWVHNYPTPVGVLVSWWQCTATQMFKTKVKKKVNTIRLALFARWIRLIWALSQFVSSQSLLHNLDTQANTIIHKDWNRVAHKQQGQLKVSIIFLSFRWLSLCLSLWIIMTI